MFGSPFIVITTGVGSFGRLFFHHDCTAFTPFLATSAASSFVCTPFTSFHRLLMVLLRSMGLNAACASDSATPHASEPARCATDPSASTAAHSPSPATAPSPPLSVDLSTPATLDAFQAKSCPPLFSHRENSPRRTSDAHSTAPAAARRNTTAPGLAPKCRGITQLTSAYAHVATR